ncbi:MAG: Gfo/Idh/MocA family protein [Planctomycetota bacterium]|jgi:predicted dehydrogenase
MDSVSGRISRRDFIERACGLGLAASVGLIEPCSAGAARAAFRKIKIGQIGTKHAHASGKIQSLRKLTDYYEVIGVVEPDGEKRKAVQGSAAYKGLKWMTEEELLNTRGLEAVAIETLKRDLVPTTMRCVKAGMHVHMDKPAGESLSAFKALLDETVRRKVTLQMGYMFRNNPGFQFCFEAVKKGWLGNVFEVHGVISKTTSAGRRKALSEYAGGTMFNLGCHLIDALVVILGRADKVTPYVRRTQGDNLADNQLAVFEYRNATATIRSTLAEVEGVKRRQFVVCGDKGTIEIKPLERPKLMLALDEPRGKYKKGYQQVDLAAMTGRYDDQLIDLARIIRGEKESDYPPSHDLIVHESVLLASGVPLG